MRMKKVGFTCLFSLFIVAGALAQTEKGGRVIGTQVGNIYIPTSGGSGSIVVLQPTYGWFVSDGLALGAGIPFTLVSGGGQRVTQIGLAPFLRYYIGTANVKPFLGASVGVINSSVSGNFSRSASSTDAIYGLTGGVAFFLNKSVSFDASLNYSGGNTASVSGLLGTGNAFTPALPDALTINLGFQVYLSKK